jgi:hypothetical protein
MVTHVSEERTLSSSGLHAVTTQQTAVNMFYFAGVKVKGCKS